MNSDKKLRLKIKELLLTPDAYRDWLSTKMDEAVFSPCERQDCPIYHFLWQSLEKAGINPDMLFLEVSDARVEWAAMEGNSKFSVRLPEWTKNYISAIDCLKEEGIVMINHIKAAKVLAAL